MTSIDCNKLAEQLRDGLRATFTELMAENPDLSFYTFALFTDDSLQFAHAAANSEEGLVKTLERYNADRDDDEPVTSNNMRWAYGDWQFFPIEAEEHLAPVNLVLQDNFTAEEDVFEAQIESLWKALLKGFSLLNEEGFFGEGDARSKITLLVVGHLSDETVDEWVEALNPEDVAQRFLDWDYG
ncbi:MAG: hypothetical protein CBB71_02665 [Rhodopirellula sp. TMED11]|nr:MAG: hypothetical protein CBB71_02665 [Rhodopirellula sp. TMED11]